MSQLSVLNPPHLPNEIRKTCDSVFIFDNTSLANKLSDFFLQHQQAIQIATTDCDFHQILKSYKPQILILNTQLMRSFNLSAKLLHTQLPNALFIALCSSDQLSDAPNTAEIFSTWITTEDFSFDSFPLILDQANKIRKLNRENTQLKTIVNQQQQALDKSTEDEEHWFKGRSTLLEQMTSKVQLPLQQLTQFSHIALQRMQRRQFSQVGHYISEVKMIAEEVITLTQEIKEINLLKSRKSRFQIEEIDIAEFLREVRRQFQPVAQSRDIDLTFQVQVGYSCIYADYQQLSKVFNILFKKLLNTLCAHREIKLKASFQDSECKITIEDPMWAQKKELSNEIFSLYTALNQTEKEESCGLSLSICKELMLGQKGNICLEKDERTNQVYFCITLPLVDNFLDE